MCTLQTEMFSGKSEEVSQLRSILSSSSQNQPFASLPRDSRLQAQDATDAVGAPVLRKVSQQQQSGFATSNSAFQLGSNSRAAVASNPNSARAANGSGGAAAAADGALADEASAAHQRNNSIANLIAFSNANAQNPQVKMTGWMNERRLHSGSVSNLVAAAGDKQSAAANGAQQSGLRPKNTDAAAEENGMFLYNMSIVLYENRNAHIIHIMATIL